MTDGSTTTTSPTDAPPGITGALGRYRVVAYAVGVALLALTVAMPVKYVWDNPTPVAVVSPIHGFLYMVYLALAYDLARRCGWRLARTLWVMVAGTIPLVTFFLEPRVERWVREETLERPAP